MPETKKRLVEVNQENSAKEILETKHSYTLKLYSAVAEYHGNIDALELIESILQERRNNGE